MSKAKRKKNNQIKNNKLILICQSDANKYGESIKLSTFDSNHIFHETEKKLENLRKKNKIIYKKNRVNFYCGELEELLTYLKKILVCDTETSVYDDKTSELIKKFPSLMEGKFFFDQFDDKAKKSYENLVKTVETDITRAKKRLINKNISPNVPDSITADTIKSIENTSTPFTQNFIKNTTKSIENTAIAAKNLIEGASNNLWESLKFATINPKRSLKAFSIFAMYTLASRPVQGMTLASQSLDNSQPSPDGPTTINQMLSRDESHWVGYYDRMESMLEEFEKHGNSIDEKNKRLFFKFLTAAFDANKANTLNDTSKKTLFRIITTELNNAYDLDNNEETAKVNRLFFMLSKLNYQGNTRDITVIFQLISRYAKQLTSRNIIPDTEDKSAIRAANIDIARILNINFLQYAANLYHIDTGHDLFRTHFSVLEELNKAAYRLDGNSIFLFRIALGTLNRLRISSDFKDNQMMNKYFGDSAKSLIEEMLQLDKHGCYPSMETNIKEAAYIEYIKYLPSTDQQSFNGLYKSVEKSEVFPHSYTYQVGSSANTPKFVINSQQALNADEQYIVEKTIRNTYLRVEHLKSTLKMHSKENVEKTVFRLQLFRNNQDYKNYGPLWGINTAGGGYAHVRAPSNQEILLEDSKEKTNNDYWYETFVYQQKDDTRNTKDKEGGNFRNLGHEVQHSLFYALIGKDELYNLPSWLIEGIANYLGNENCFKEEADYIKHAHKEGRFLSVERITNLNYADGGDLYYFGSTLVRFMLDQHPAVLTDILSAAQTGEKISEINTIIKTKLISSSVEKEFKAWTTQLINTCSLSNSRNNPDLEVQEQYRKDLANNPSLLAFIEKNGVITFSVNDADDQDKIADRDNNIIYELKATRITATRVLQYTSGAKEKTPLNIDHESDYSWFKSKLLIYILHNRLQQQGIPKEEQVKIIQKFTHSDVSPSVSIENLNRIMRINPTPDKNFVLLIENFILTTNTLELRGQLLSNKEELDHAIRETINQKTTLKQCYNYLGSSAATSESSTIAPSLHQTAESITDSPTTTITSASPTSSQAATETTQTNAATEEIPSIHKKLGNAIYISNKKEVEILLNKLPSNDPLSGLMLVIKRWVITKNEADKAIATRAKNHRQLVKTSQNAKDILKMFFLRITDENRLKNTLIALEEDMPEIKDDHKSILDLWQETRSHSSTTTTSEQVAETTEDPLSSSVNKPSIEIVSSTEKNSKEEKQPSKTTEDSSSSSANDPSIEIVSSTEKNSEEEKQPSKTIEDPSSSRANDPSIEIVSSTEEKEPALAETTEDPSSETETEMESENFTLEPSTEKNSEEEKQPSKTTEITSATTAIETTATDTSTHPSHRSHLSSTKKKQQQDTHSRTTTTAKHNIDSISSRSIHPYITAHHPLPTKGNFFSTAVPNNLTNNHLSSAPVANSTSGPLDNSASSTAPLGSTSLLYMLFSPLNIGGCIGFAVTAATITAVILLCTKKQEKNYSPLLSNIDIEKGQQGSDQPDSSPLAPKIPLRKNPGRRNIKDLTIKTLLKVPNFFQSQHLPYSPLQSINSLNTDVEKGQQSSDQPDSSPLTPKIPLRENPGRRNIKDLTIKTLLKVPNFLQSQSQPLPYYRLPSMNSLNTDVEPGEAKPTLFRDTTLVKSVIRSTARLSKFFTPLFTASRDEQEIELIPLPTSSKNMNNV